MVYEWESELPALASLSDEEAATEINGMTVTERKSRRITYRDVLAVVRDPAVVEAVASYVQTKMPTVDGMLRTYSAEGGIDTFYEETRAQIDALVGPTPLTQAQADVLKTLGLEVRPKYGMRVGPHHVAHARSLLK